ncbi:hypothetical protein ABKV19_004528 [Rosa sericea]
MIVDWSTYGYISTHPSLNLRFIQKEEQSKIKQEEKIIIKSAENLAYHLRYTATTILALMQEVAHFLRTKGYWWIATSDFQTSVCRVHSFC